MILMSQILDMISKYLRTIKKKEIDYEIIYELFHLFQKNQEL